MMKYDGEPSDAEGSGPQSLQDHIEAEPRDYEDDLYSPSEPGAVNVILRTSPKTVSSSAVIAKSTEHPGHT